MIGEAAASLVRADHGRASPLIPITRHGSPAMLSESGTIAFLYARSASVLGARVVNDLPAEVRDACYLTHGHAAFVVFLDGQQAAADLLERLGDDVAAWELWPYERGEVAGAAIRWRAPEPAPGWPTLESVRSADIGYESGAQIRQFNANLAVLSGILAVYAPEMLELPVWLHESVTDMAKQLVELQETTDETALRAGVALESVLIETNAVLTLFCSQIGSGTVPITASTFAVGEYSLLGIGGMCRAAWRLYDHLNKTFAQFGHADTVHQSYTFGAAFDVFAPSQRSDFSAWANSPVNLARLPSTTSDSKARYHIPYFSSRWGFHEALHSISISWQCLHASATKEWNLLTVTHEFLHAHVREIMDQIRLPQAGATFESLATRHRERSSGTTAMESMQVAIVEALVGIRGAQMFAPNVPGGQNVERHAPVPNHMNGAGILELMKAHDGLLQEIIVHVLDFHYTYGGRDRSFIDSLWSSWSLVPAVIDNVEVYVLRTLSALASSSPSGPSEQVFDDAVARLRRCLIDVGNRPRTRPAIQRALLLLNDETRLRRLCVRFLGTRYVVELAKNFFLDERLNAALFRDDQTTVIDGRSTYNLPAGEFVGETPNSPIGFLLDRFDGYANQAGSSEAEYESIWQLIQLI